MAEAKLAEGEKANDDRVLTLNLIATLMAEQFPERLLVNDKAT